MRTSLHDLTPVLKYVAYDENTLSSSRLSSTKTVQRCKDGCDLRLARSMFGSENLMSHYELLQNLLTAHDQRFPDGCLPYCGTVYETSGKYYVAGNLSQSQQFQQFDCNTIKRILNFVSDGLPDGLYLSNILSEVALGVDYIEGLDETISMVPAVRHQDCMGRSSVGSSIRYQSLRAT